MRRLKDDVKEVKEGFECGIKLRNYNDIKEGDQLEFFEIKEIARTLWANEVRSDNMAAKKSAPRQPQPSRWPTRSRAIQRERDRSSSRAS